MRPAAPRYRNEIGKYSIRRASNCVACGRCVEVCQHGVHVRPRGYRSIIRPFDYRCIGSDCDEDRTTTASTHVPRRPSRFPKIRSSRRWATTDGRRTFWSARGPWPRRAARRETTWKARWGPPVAALTACGSVSRRAACGPAPRGHLDNADSESPERFAAQDRHRRPLVRRRHVVRLDQHPRPAGQSPGGQGIQQLHLHGRRRISGTAYALQGPRDHAGGHGALRRARGDDPAGADRGIQVRPGGQAGTGRPPARRQEHAERGRDA